MPEYEFGRGDLGMEEGRDSSLIIRAKDTTSDGQTLPPSGYKYGPPNSCLCMEEGRPTIIPVD